MTELLYFIVFGIILFSVYVWFIIRKTYIDFLLTQTTLEQMPIFFTEYHDNMICLYDQKTSAFQCQAKTLEELAKEFLMTRKITLAKVKDNTTELWFVRGIVCDAATHTLEVKLKYDKVKS
jgi:hypothetical protein